MLGRFPVAQKRSPNQAPSVRPVRCAIYTRVSTEHGLDQEFNSLDAQYDAASAYIKSQVHAGWTQIRSRYDDGGYSGGSTDRPDLQKLLGPIGSPTSKNDTKNSVASASKYRSRKVDSACYRTARRSMGNKQHPRLTVAAVTTHNPLDAIAHLAGLK